jgi:hypothetical protein
MHSTAGFAHRAFEDIADTELAPDLLHIDGPAFVGKARIAGENDEPADVRQRGGDLLHHAVGKIFLLGISADVLDRQNDERGLLRQWQGGACRRAKKDAEGPDLRRGVLERRLAEVVDLQSILPEAASCTRDEMQMPPGSASGSSRAAMITPSPTRSSLSGTTSP